MKPASLVMRAVKPQRLILTRRTAFYNALPQFAQRVTAQPFAGLQPRFPTTVRRYNSSLAVPDSDSEKSAPRPAEPSYELTFTCKPCSHRSSHVITKHGYHKGTVLIQCPNCKNRHVISDHLKIFMDQKSTLEDILKSKAGTDGDITHLLKKGRLGMRQGELVGREGDEDIEFWDDGTESQHQTAQS